MPVLFFYVPGLGYRHNTTVLPPNVAFFPTGLPRPASDTAAAQSEQVSLTEKRISDILPFAPGKARAVLDAMLRMGDEYSAGGLLKELAARHLLQNMKNKWQSDPAETADIAHFAQTGEAPERQSGPVPRDWSAPLGSKTASPEDIRQEMESCQKVLLLAASLEQRESELEAIEERYADLEYSLNELLTEGQGDDFAEISTPLAEDAVTNQFDDPGGETSLSWRAMVDAALPFLPEGAALYTDDARMALDMRDAGMLRPLPEDKAAECSGWPQEITAGLLLASLPAWRLVGRRGGMPSRPWLENEVEVFVARPKGGWTASPTEKGGDREAAQGKTS